MASPVVDSGVVSVVIVNYRGAEDTIECLGSLRTLDWPADRLQMVVVDNASGDGSVDRIRAAAPDVTLVASPTNTGFAGGCNLGVEQSRGEYVAFINSDARPHPAWLTEAVHALQSQPNVGCIASKVLDWDGERIDYVGGSINFVGQGYKLEAGDADEGQYDTPRRVLFPTGSAMIVRSELYRRLDGFDEQFFMFFEDVDFGWRMNLSGHDVQYLPASLVFHRHHAAIKKFGSYREHYLLARNSLLSVYKNFGDETLAKVLAPALLLAVHNGVLLGEADPTTLDLQRSPGGDEQNELTVDKLTMTGAYAVDYLARELPGLTRQREQIQGSRVRSDEALASLFGDLLQGTSPARGYHAAWLNTVKAFGLAEGVLRRRRVAVITADTLSNQMAGPAIRAYHIAETLSEEHDVKLVSTTTCTLKTHKFESLIASPEKLRDIVGWADIVVFQGFVMHQAPWLVSSNKIIVVDIYDPMHLEQLEQSRADEPTARAANIAATTAVLNEQLERGDFFLCASEEQRHFWLGQLAGVGRLNPRNYDRDSSLRSLLAVSPFGLPQAEPQRTRRAIKDVVPGISGSDKVILWGGGVYNWFDPLSLIRAVDAVHREHDDVRLFFLGMKHPNPNVPEMRMAWDARQLADALGLTDKVVFFNEEWVDYDDRQNYLLDADAGVSTHFLHVETTFSFRTRMLDYLWAGLPIVATEGDAFGRLIAAEGLGVTVPERDVDALAQGLTRVLYDEEFLASCRRNVAEVRQRFTWHQTLEPLNDFCRHAARAADAELVGTRLLPASPVHRGRLARNVDYARVRYREGGMSLVAERGASKLKRLLKGGRS
jgi:GT2 family glycosyltransferase/glycosyltransferase involved in cell wall biosynthesis